MHGLSDLEAAVLERDPAVLNGLAHVHHTAAARARSRGLVGVHEDAGGAADLRLVLLLQIAHHPPQRSKRLERERAVFFSRP